jgi:hypothetical protein
VDFQWAEFWLKVGRTIIVDAAWPIVALVGLLLFRQPLGKLIGRIRRAGLTGVEAEPEVSQQEAPSIKEQIAEGLRQTTGGNALTLPAPTPLIKFVEGNITETLKQRGLDNLSTDDQKRLFIREYALLTIKAHFEQIGRLIFGTQILLLKRLQVDGPIGRQAAMAIFRKHVRRLRDAAISRPANFDAWIDYLIQTDLIRVNDQDCYTLQPLGEDFLLFAKASNLTEETRWL